MIATEAPPLKGRPLLPHRPRRYHCRLERRARRAGARIRVEKPTRLECRLGDDRFLEIDFAALGSGTKNVEEFEAEAMNSVEQQRTGWQSILDNFKCYAESL